MGRDGQGMREAPTRARALRLPGFGSPPSAGSGLGRVEAVGGRRAKRRAV